MLQQARLHGGRPDVPGIARHVEKRAVAAPTVGIAVFIHLAQVQLVVRDGPVAERAFGLSILHVHAGESARHGVEKTPVFADRVLHRQPRGLAQPKVVFAVHHRGVHDARPFVDRDEGRLEHRPRGIGAGAVHRSLEERAVAPPGEIAGAHFPDDLIRVPQHLGDAVAGQDEHLAGRSPAGPVVRPRGGGAAVLAPAVALALGQDAYAGIGDVRAHGEAEVARKRPGGRGPAQDPRAVRVVLKMELHVDRGLGHVPVALRDLVARESGAAARARRDDAVSPVQQAALLDLRQRPPARLDELRRVRDVRVAVVQPVADVPGQPLPGILVAEHVVPALVVEPSDPVALDVRLAGDAERTLDLEFHRQPVRVPARLPRHVGTGHGAVSRHRVLDRAGKDVMDAGRGVRGRRPLVEHEVRRIRSGRKAALERRLFLPACEDFGFEPAYGLRYWPVGHGGTPSGYFLDGRRGRRNGGRAQRGAAVRSTRRPNRRRRPG